jgi:hypothetical protein
MEMTHITHFGTMAFGGGVLTFVSLIGILFTWWAKKL